MNTKIFFTLLTLCTLLCYTAQAQFSQPGELDTTFNFGRPHSFFSSLANPLPGEGAIGIIQIIVRQPDGKMLIGGDFTSYNGTPRNGIARLNADGRLDSSFNMGTGADSAIQSLILQTDGKVLIVGNFINYNGTPRNRIARLNANGNLDATFNPGTGANDLVNSLVLQQNGKLLIGGDFTTYNGAPRNRIARLNADGSLDASFNPGSGADGTVRSLALQPDAKVLIGGMFTSYNDTPRRRIARLNADGSLDSTFNPAGTGANNLVSSFALQPDRKVLIGGWFTNYNGTSRNFIARLNADGSLDASFNSGTEVQGGQLPIVQSLALQPDGKVLIGGFFSIFTEPSSNHIVRLNANGTLDASFNPGTGLEGGLLPSVESLALLPDGKVLIGGEFISYNGTPRNGIARLNADGRLDSTFNPSTGVDNGVESLALQSDGKVLIGGSFSSYNGTPRSNIARLNADGSIDATFNPGTGANDMVNSLAFQPDGKVLIGGMFTNYNNTPRRRIARLNADGSLDVSFNPGTGANDEVYSFALQPDRKVLIGGMFTNYNDTSRRRIARLNADGSLDASFNPGTGVQGGPFPIVESLVLQPDGKVLIGGWFSSYNGTSRNYIAGLNADGSLDANFNPGPGIGANSSVRSLALQPDDKVLIGGRFTDYNGTSRNRIAGLNADGSLDAGFNPGTGANDWVNSLVLQPDGKVLIGGQFFSYNGTPRKRIARLNADGSLDVGFNPGTGANNGGVESLALQPDGKVLIGGRFTDYNGTSRNRIARLNADGSLDAGFNPGTGANDEVIAFALQPDGKVLIGGRFTNYNGTPRNRIARLNADGSLDAGFNPGTGADLDVVALSLQPDGKVLIGGDFNNYNGTSRNKIARLNADGSLDASFNPVIGANNTIRSFALQPDGKVLIGGSFTTYNGTPRNRIARLNADGSLDDSFNPGTGANDWVNSLALQPDGKVLIGGWFTSYNGTYRPRIARVFANSNSSLPVSITRLAARQQQGNVAVEWTVAAETGVKHYEVEHSTNGHDFGKTGVVRARNSGAATYSFIHQQPGSGNHYYRLRSEDIDGKSQLTQVVKVTLGSSQKGFGVYPTLVSGNRLTIELNGLGKGRYTLQLNDMAGKMLMNSAIQHDGGSATQNLQLPAGLAAGTYLIRLQGEGSSYSQKIVKE